MIDIRTVHQYVCSGCQWLEMQGSGQVQFLNQHHGSVRGVAFHPTDRYLFCSGAYDGKVNLYSAQKGKFIQSYAITTVSLVRNVNAVRFCSDGSKILATSTSRRLTVVDVEKGEQVLAYDNCAFNGRDRTALCVDPASPNLAFCTCVNGKGLALFDLRMPLPLDFLYDLHSGVIRDVMYLDGSWPWCGSQRGVVTVATDGICKVSTLDGRGLHNIDTNQSLQSVTATPENYDTAVDDGFSSLLVFGGEDVSAYLPDCGIQETLTENKDVPVWKVRYNSHGSKLYTVCDNGVVRHYRRWPDRHLYLGELFRHTSDIEDMDISPYDEYIVTASKDRTVGLMQLGPPSHGTSEYFELT